MSKLIRIGEASRILGVSIDTLRRWDEAKHLPSIRVGKTGIRMYNEDEIKSFSQKIQESKLNVVELAKQWIYSQDSYVPEPSKFYSENSSIFQTRLMKFGNIISKVIGLEKEFSLISSMVGEIGNNSFDHNLGNWPDILGNFFAYDLDKRQIVLADRGQGILKTLKRVRPKLDTDKKALKVAFTEIVSGRHPEARGNGLKYVVDVITNKIKDNKIELLFQTGSAQLTVSTDNKEIKIKSSSKTVRGCIAIINF
jgi:excisionase family DNA binding protein